MKFTIDELFMLRDALIYAEKNTGYAELKSKYVELFKKIGKIIEQEQK